MLTFLLNFAKSLVLLGHNLTIIIHLNVAPTLLYYLISKPYTILFFFLLLHAHIFSYTKCYFIFMDAVLFIPCTDEIVFNILTW